MGLTLEQIHELQGHFDALGKLNKVYNAIQCYSKKNSSSFIYSYVDGWNKKQFVNIPVDEHEMSALIFNHMAKIESDIIKLTTRRDEIDVDIMGEEDLLPIIEEYGERYPEACVGIDLIRNTLRKAFFARPRAAEFARLGFREGYRVNVLGGWQDRFYEFDYLGSHDDGTLIFKFLGVVTTDDHTSSFDPRTTEALMDAKASEDMDHVSTKNLR